MLCVHVHTSANYSGVRGAFAMHVCMWRRLLHNCFLRLYIELGILYTIVQPGINVHKDV